MLTQLAATVGPSKPRLECGAYNPPGCDRERTLDDRILAEISTGGGACLAARFRPRGLSETVRA